MIKGLLDFGHYLESIGGDEDAGFGKPKLDDPVLFVTLDRGGVITTSENATGALIASRLLFYRGSNGSVLTGGAGGVGGASPFFLKTTLLDDSAETLDGKIGKSRTASAQHARGVGDKDLLEAYFSRLGEHVQALRSKAFRTVVKRKVMVEEPVSVYFLVTRVDGVDTGALHAHFIEKIKDAGRRKDTVPVEGVCSTCGERRSLAEPGFKFYANVKPIFKRHFLKQSTLATSRFQICTGCNATAVKAWDKMTELFSSGYVLVPSVIAHGEEGTGMFYELFVKTVNEANSSLERLMDVLRESTLNERATFTFVVYKKGKSTAIKRYVDNIKLHLYRFERLHLVVGGAMQYMPVDEDLPADGALAEIKTFFDLERCLQCFFVEEHVDNKKRCTNKKFSKPFFMLHQDLPKKMPAEFKHLLRVHEDDLVTFIYDAEPESLRSEVLDGICHAFLMYQARHLKADTRYILERDMVAVLNVYYFLKNKVLGEPMLKQKIDELKVYFRDLVVMEGERKVIDDEVGERIKAAVTGSGLELFYYLLGNFCKRLDAMRYSKDKKNPLFEGFVRGVNRKDFAKRFQETILQKQLHYIDKMAIKTRFAFDVIAQFLDEFRRVDGYERAMIAMITGYYGINLLQDDEGKTDGKNTS